MSDYKSKKAALRKMKDAAKDDIEYLEQSGVIEAYEEILRKLCEMSLPPGNIREWAAAEFEMIALKYRSTGRRIARREMGASLSPVHRSPGGRRIGGSTSSSPTMLKRSMGRSSGSIAHSLS